MTRTIIPLLVAGVVAAASLTGRAAADAGPAVPAPVTGSAPVAGCTGEPISVVAPVEVAARLSDRRVEPAVQRVDVPWNAPIVLRVEVDTPVIVHVHGYERMADAAPGAPACLEFVADVPGLFEVYAHPVPEAPETLLVQLAVR